MIMIFLKYSEDKMKQETGLQFALVLLLWVLQRNLIANYKPLLAPAHTHSFNLYCP